MAKTWLLEIVILKTHIIHAVNGKGLSRRAKNRSSIMAQPQLEQRVIEAARDVDRLWRDVGPYHPHMSTALALLSRSLSKLKVWREGRREEAYDGQV